MTHAPDCAGDDAPWCSPACAHARRLVSVDDACHALGITPDALYGAVRRKRLRVAARVRRDRGRPALMFSAADLHAFSRDTPDTQDA